MHMALTGGRPGRQNAVAALIFICNIMK